MTLVCHTPLNKDYSMLNFSGSLIFRISPNFLLGISPNFSGILKIIIILYLEEKENSASEL